MYVGVELEQLLAFFIGSAALDQLLWVSGG
jgi:hypothetical protein